MNDLILMAIAMLLAAAILRFVGLCLAAGPGAALDDRDLYVESGLLLVPRPWQWKLWPRAIVCHTDTPHQYMVQWLFLCLWWSFDEARQEHYDRLDWS